jgi:predicted nuclease of predicted toxin-antitoxin system
MALDFHLDENVHLAVAEALRRRGIDATTPSDADLIGASDAQQLAFAGDEGRVLVTHDADFLRLHAQGVEHAGIVFCHAGRRTLRELIGGVLLLSASTPPADMQNRVVFL